ncbi:MAG: ATP-dependent DNA ligase [Chloroflexi bacterium]|nr:ATP-dependent DNA ligase [Chloroflexota bacterium]
MLEKYVQRRDFGRSPEPFPRPPLDEARSLIFVVHKHAARRLHYDFRLQLDGVLKSWSVPKGPSYDPAEKRLAVMVEDHPLDYASFEGVIPTGEYGAGQVIVWDFGIYSPDDEGRLSFHNPSEAQDRMRQNLAEGKVSLRLRGRKLQGSWVLVKTQRGNDWLLIRHKDQFAERFRGKPWQEQSVLSGLTIEDLKSGHLPDPSQMANLTNSPDELSGARPTAFPTTMAPMLASMAAGIFSSPDWLFEPKLDGVRAIALIRNGSVKLLSRRGLDITNQYPSVARDLLLQPETGIVLDGEIIAPDEEGRPSFQRLQQRLNLLRESDVRKAEEQVPILYYIFDLLYFESQDLRRVPLRLRKDLLARVLEPSSRVFLLDHFEGDGEIAYKAAVEQGLEGVIAKHRDSIYESGKRSRSWLKAKATLSDDFIVGGYTQGQGARADTFGALLLGYRDDQNRLVYAGHVGSGFDEITLRDLRRMLDSLKSASCAFSETPSPNAPATWVRPELVVEIQFAQWTKDGRLRAPVFRGIREDKLPREVRRIEVIPIPSDLPSQEVSFSAVTKEAKQILECLEDSREQLVLETEGHQISLSNLHKQLWPVLDGHPALTKRDLLVYLAQMAPYLLNHLRDRPLTLARYPDGIHGEHFYQKHWDNPLPEFVETVRLFSSHNEGDQDYLLCNNLATLMWLGQLADLELHTWFSRISPKPDAPHLSARFAGSAANVQGSLLNYPDFMVFDLDPYIYSGRESKGAEPELHSFGFSKTCEIALELKAVLDTLSLSSFVKTSGRTGLHVYVPVRRQFDYDAVRAATETIGRYLAQRRPREVTLEWTIDRRVGKVFVDYNQNMRGKTLACPYSPRPTTEATVSMPLRWDELGQVYPTDFTILSAPQRLSKMGDLWSGILEAKHDLKAILEKTGTQEK